MFAAEMNYDLLFSTFAFVFGACVGSFLNVCIYRLPLNLSVNQPRRSFCPSCKTQIPWHQNLPLVSWLALRGRCANCGARIAFRYFAVELLTAFFFLLIWKAFPCPIAIAYWVFIALVIDAIRRFHYNRVQVGSETFRLDQLDKISGTANEIEIPREAMGRGDLKFLACIGAFLGWRAVLFAIFAGSLYGSMIGLITLVLGRRVWSLKLPFGPYLALRAITWMFFGDSVVRWYQTLLRPSRP